MQNEFREIRRADAAAIQAVDARMGKLVEMIAATQVTLDEVADRVADLETVAAAPEAFTPSSAASSNGPSSGGPYADELTAGAADSDEMDSDAVELEASPLDELPPAPTPTPRAPRQDPASTPDLREW
jgi:hypothetical protein